MNVDDLFSNGNSFNNGDAMSTVARPRNLELRVLRFLRPLQDRGSI